MAKLADMEELLLDISNPDVADYMSEAYSCYGAGAYRGCIVMSYIAVFDDIRIKLIELAKSNGKAEAIWKNIKLLCDGEKPFENPMVEQLVKQDLMTEADRKQLLIIQSLRNSAAHPSGINVSAEQARMVYTESIRSFLSKPVLKAALAADRVIERLATKNLFPTKNASDARAVTEDEISGLHPSAYTYLTKKLIEGIGSWTNESNSNARAMLFGLAQLHNDIIRKVIRADLVIDKANDSKFSQIILLCLSVDGTLFEGQNKITRQRLNQLLLDSVKASELKSPAKSIHAVHQMESLIGTLGLDEAIFEYGEFIDAALNSFPYTDELIAQAKVSKPFFGMLFNIWEQRSRSTDFPTANNFADAIQIVDTCADVMTDAQALSLLAGVVAAANSGAWHAKGLQNNQFDDAPLLKAKALKHIASKKTSAKSIIENRAVMNVKKFKSILVNDDE